MRIMYKRNYRDKNNEYPLMNRDKFLKTIKPITCSLTLIDFDWMEDREIYKAHREYDKENPKEAQEFSTEQIKKGLKKLVELGYVSEKITT